MPNQHSKLSELPRIWICNVEPHVIRPEGWDGCWLFLSHFRLRHSHWVNKPVEPKKDPMSYFVEYDAENGWVKQLHPVRRFISEIFWNWVPEARWHAPKTRRGRDGVDKTSVSTRRVSQWSVGLECGDRRCINPNHFKFIHATEKRGTMPQRARGKSKASLRKAYMEENGTQLPEKQEK